MKPAEILERLETAKEIIAAFPEDTSVLTVQVDGLVSYGVEANTYIHLATPFQRLVEAGVIGNGTWTTTDDPKRDYLSESISISGFSIIHLKDREKAAPGVDGTGDSEAAQSATEDTLIIDIGKEEVKP